MLIRHGGDYIAIHTSIEPYYTPETNMLYVNISIEIDGRRKQLKDYIDMDKLG